MVVLKLLRQAILTVQGSYRPAGDPELIQTLVPFQPTMSQQPTPRLITIKADPGCNHKNRDQMAANRQFILDNLPDGWEDDIFDHIAVKIGTSKTAPVLTGDDLREYIYVTAVPVEKYTARVSVDRSQAVNTNIDVAYDVNALNPSFLPGSAMDNVVNHVVNRPPPQASYALMAFAQQAQAGGAQQPLRLGSSWGSGFSTLLQSTPAPQTTTQTTRTLPYYAPAQPRPQGPPQITDTRGTAGNPFIFSGIPSVIPLGGPAAPIVLPGPVAPLRTHAPLALPPPRITPGKGTVPSSTAARLEAGAAAWAQRRSASISSRRQGRQ